MLDVNVIYICNRNWPRRNAADYRITTAIMRVNRHTHWQRSLNRIFSNNNSTRQYSSPRLDAV